MYILHEDLRRSCGAQPVAGPLPKSSAAAQITGSGGTCDWQGCAATPAQLLGNSFASLTQLLCISIPTPRIWTMPLRTQYMNMSWIVLQICLFNSLIPTLVLKNVVCHFLLPESEYVALSLFLLQIMVFYNVIRIEETTLVCVFSRECILGLQHSCFFAYGVPKWS